MQNYNYIVVFTGKYCLHIQHVIVQTPQSMVTVKELLKLEAKLPVYFFLGDRTVTITLPSDFGVKSGSPTSATFSTILSMIDLPISV